MGQNPSHQNLLIITIALISYPLRSFVRQEFSILEKREFADYQVATNLNQLQSDHSEISKLSNGRTVNFLYSGVPKKINPFPDTALSSFVIRQGTRGVGFYFIKIYCYYQFNDGKDKLPCSFNLLINFISTLFLIF